MNFPAPFPRENPDKAVTYRNYRQMAPYPFRLNVCKQCVVSARCARCDPFHHTTRDPPSRCVRACWYFSWHFGTLGMKSRTTFNKKNGLNNNFTATDAATASSTTPKNTAKCNCFAAVVLIVVVVIVVLSSLLLLPW